MQETPSFAWRTNAYGLTEAPLVTMNRSGANRVGTVGSPLPETSIRIAADGEVLVSGPQVAAGYFHQEDQSVFKDAWLHTGDLGYLTAEGNLVIHGRKKEVIITSYGKNIRGDDHLIGRQCFTDGSGP